MSSIDDAYRNGYADGYMRGSEIERERAMNAALSHRIEMLCDVISSYPMLWEYGDGYGGDVRWRLERAFEAYGFPAPEPTHPDSRPKRKSLGASKVIAVMSKSHGQCLACGSKDNLQVDHILPVSRGGTNELDNLQMLCQRCNGSKHNKTMEEWQGEAA